MQTIASMTVSRIAAALLFLAAYAVAETITLRDGSKITGTITKQTETIVELRTTYGTLTIDKSNITSIDFGGGSSQPAQQPSIMNIIQQQQQQQQQQPQQQQPSVVSVGDYDRGYSVGKAAGYDDGLKKGKAERKSAALTGSLIGWLAWILVVVVAVASSSGA